MAVTATWWSARLVGTAVMLLGCRAQPARETDTAELSAFVSAAGEYLERAVNPDGSFVYIYYPLDGTESTDYNILRHAGAAYALVQAYEVSPRPPLLRAAENALAYLLRSMRPCDGNPAELCVVEEGWTKLGGNALAVLALTKYAEVTGDAAVVPCARRLASHMVSLQARSGEFATQKQAVGSADDPGLRSQYYPGEALLALLRLYALDGGSEWADAAHRGLDWLMLHDGPGPDQWLLLALNEAHADRPDRTAYRITSKTIALASVREQRRWWMPGAAPLGAFDGDGRSTPTSARVEGIMAAHALLSRAGDDSTARALLAGAERAMRLVTAAQVTGRRARRFADPGRALGGVLSASDGNDIRIDYVQHAISAAVSLRAALMRSALSPDERVVTPGGRTPATRTVADVGRSAALQGRIALCIPVPAASQDKD